MAAADVFRALGDPVRLEMVMRLSLGKPCTISDVSSQLGISRQGARKHLQVLVDANVATLKPQGRDVMVQLDPEGIDQAKAFISELEAKWDQRLESLRRYLESDIT